MDGRARGRVQDFAGTPRGRTVERRTVVRGAPVVGGERAKGEGTVAARAGKPDGRQSVHVPQNAGDARRHSKGNHRRPNGNRARVGAMENARRRARRNGKSVARHAGLRRRRRADPQNGERRYGSDERRNGQGSGKRHQQRLGSENDQVERKRIRILWKLLHLLALKQIEAVCDI